MADVFSVPVFMTVLARDSGAAGGTNPQVISAPKRQGGVGRVVLGDGHVLTACWGALGCPWCLGRSLQGFDPYSLPEATEARFY